MNDVEKLKEFHKRKTDFLNKYPSVTVAGMHDFGVMNIVNNYADGNCNEIQCINKIITKIDHNSKLSTDQLIIKNIQKS